MSNRIYNTQTANTREASSKKIGHYGRGQNDAPALCPALVVPLTSLAPPLKIFVVVLFAVKLISSDPILISPEDGNAAELAKGISVTVSLIVEAKVVVAAPKAVPDHKPVPQPKPPNCCAGPTV